jgi:glycosyltransferase involved in cell wall biosynthesis
MWGGVERFLVTLARERDYAPDMHPHFAVCFRDRLSHELRMAGAPVDYLGEVRTSLPFTVLRARKALETLLLQEKVDVGVCHLPWAHAIFAPVLRHAKVPVVFWMHGFATGRHWTERWAKLSPPALVIANSQATAKTAPALFPKTRTEVLFYPVSLEAEPRREVPGTIVQVSRMEPWKGHRLHLEALALLKNEPGWQCRFVGGAQTKSEISYVLSLRKRAKSLEIEDRVEFLGQRSDVETQLAEASVFCQPNTGPEPFGIVFVEALAAGVPVVTTAMGAAPEIIDESCGVLTTPASAASLAAALKLLLHDPALRQRLGNVGPRRAATLCSPERQMPALARLLRESLGKAKLESQAK